MRCLALPLIRLTKFHLFFLSDARGPERGSRNCSLSLHQGRRVSWKQPWMLVRQLSWGVFMCGMLGLIKVTSAIGVAHMSIYKRCHQNFGRHQTSKPRSLGEVGLGHLPNRWSNLSSEVVIFTFLLLYLLVSDIERFIWNVKQTSVQLTKLVLTKRTKLQRWMHRRRLA